MAWEDNLAQFLGQVMTVANPSGNAAVSTGITTALQALGTHLVASNTSTTQSQLNQMLSQVQGNPQLAPFIVLQIASLPNVPPTVSELVQQIPNVATDKVALANLIIQIHTAYGQANNMGAIGSILSGFGLSS